MAYKTKKPAMRDMFVKVFGKHNEGAKLGGTLLEWCLH
jgi:hypothetical protein